jgi:molybdopterin converting factor small subunit
MSNVFTLESLREEVEREFAPLKITLRDGSEVTLINLLRLKKKERKEALALMDTLDTDEESQSDEELDAVEELAANLFGLVADRPDELLEEIGDDFQVLLRVLEMWMEATQPGEAESSPNS